jgi:hypothetical protein
MSIAALLLFIRALGLTLPLWIVAGWSAAEAAIFFLVADIPISWIAVRSGTRAAVLAAIVAAVASVVGALAIFFWAGRDPIGAAATMASLPAIDPALIAKAAQDYQKGALAMLEGSFSGTPFKLYALEAAKDPDYSLLLLAPCCACRAFSSLLCSPVASRTCSSGACASASALHCWPPFGCCSMLGFSR